MHIYIYMKLHCILLLSRFFETILKSGVSARFTIVHVITYFLKQRKCNYFNSIITFTG